MNRLLERFRSVTSRTTKQVEVAHRSSGRVDEPSMSSGNDVGADSRIEFAMHLSTILDRPWPEHIVCGCCGYESRVAKLDTLNATCIFTGLSLIRVRCGECRAVIGPLPLIEATSDEIGTLYRFLYQFYHEGFSSPFQEKTFYLLNPSRHGCYLNYACGDWSVGYNRLKSFGWQVVGFEPFQATDSTGFLKSRSELGSQSFDGLFSHNFIEHLQHPEAFFRECYELLKPSGTMIHSTPCYRYLYEVAPLHLYFYCDTSIERLANRVGFRLTIVGLRTKTWQVRNIWLAHFKNHDDRNQSYPRVTNDLSLNPFRVESGARTTSRWNKAKVLESLRII